jgi:hypothetical protein
MSPRTIAVGVVASLLLLALIIELVRRRKLRIGYSLLWLFISLMLFALVLFRQPVAFVSQLLGVRLPSSFLFAAGIAFSLLILLEHSLTLTILWRQDKNLAQTQALLEWRVRQLEYLEELGEDLGQEPETLITSGGEIEAEAQEDVIHARG